MLFQTFAGNDCRQMGTDIAVLKFDVECHRKDACDILDGTRGFSIKFQFKDIEANFVCQVIFAAAAVYVPALVVAKLNLVSFYHRIMEGQAAYNWEIHIISPVICGYSLALVFALILRAIVSQRPGI